MWARKRACSSFTRIGPRYEPWCICVVLDIQYTRLPDVFLHNLKLHSHKTQRALVQLLLKTFEYQTTLVKEYEY